MCVDNEWDGKKIYTWYIYIISSLLLCTNLPGMNSLKKCVGSSLNTRRIIPGIPVIIYDTPLLGISNLAS